MQKLQANFLFKLACLLNNQKYDDIICYRSHYNQIIVNNLPVLQQKILPKFFKHRNLLLFRKQLQVYSFNVKIKNEKQMLRKRNKNCKKNQNFKQYMLFSKHMAELNKMKSKINFELNQFKDNLTTKNSEELIDHIFNLKKCNQLYLKLIDQFVISINKPSSDSSTTSFQIIKQDPIYQQIEQESKKYFATYTQKVICII